MGEARPPAAAVRGTSGPIELLGRRDFARVWIAGTLFNVMRWLDMLAVGVWVFGVTGSPVTVALMLFLRLLPLLLFGAYVGALAERHSPRALLVGGLFLLSLLYLGLGLLAASGRLEVWQLAIGVFVSGTFWAVELPIRRTMLAELAGLERIGAAMGLEASTNNLTRMLGPTLGGALLQFVGLHGAFLLGTVLYLAAALLVLSVRYDVERAFAIREKGVLANIGEGIRYVRTNRFVVAGLAVTVVVNLFGFSYASMVPVIGADVLGLDALRVGLLLSAEGAGAFVGSVVVAFLARQSHFGPIFAGGSVAFLAAVVVFALSPSYALSLAVLTIGGFGIAGFSAMQSALILFSTPREMRNRVMGVLAMCIGSGPLGVLLVGLMAGAFGAVAAVTAIASAGLIAIIALAARFPELRRPSAEPLPAAAARPTTPEGRGA